MAALTQVPACFWRRVTVATSMHSCAAMARAPHPRSMSFISDTCGRCALCDVEVLGTRCTYARDGAIVHSGRCSVPYACGVGPIAMQRYRCSHHCIECGEFHAEVCGRPRLCTSLSITHCQPSTSTA